MNKYNNDIIQCIKNKDLIELINVSKDHHDFSKEVFQELKNSNDYETIACFVNNSYLYNNETNTVLSFLFTELKREILFLLIENKDEFIIKKLNLLMIFAIKNEDYEVMTFLKGKVEFPASILNYAVDFDMFEFLINLGVSINDDGYAFNKAILKNRFTIVKYLHENSNVKVEVKGFCDLDLNLSIEMTEYLINLGISIPEINVLFAYAVKKGDAYIVEYLIQNGANEVKNLFQNQISKNVVKILIDNKIDIYGVIFFETLGSCDIETLIYMIDNEINIHYNHDYLLSHNVSIGNMKNVELLLNNGANIHTVNNEPLKLAIWNGDIDMIEYLLNNGAIIDSNTLIYAIVTGKLNLVKYFIEEQNINANNQEALKYSVKCMNVEIFNYLIDNGAEIHDIEELLRECFITYIYFTSTNIDNRNNDKTNMWAFTNT